MLVTTRRRLRFLAKDTLWKGTWGRIFTALGGIPVARGAADREALRTCIEVIEAGEPLVMFPRGPASTVPRCSRCSTAPPSCRAAPAYRSCPWASVDPRRPMPKGATFIKPRPVRLVVGPPLVASTATGSKARRAVVRDRTAELHRVVQDLFDRAQQEAGTPNPQR